MLWAPAEAKKKPLYRFGHFWSICSAMVQESRNIIYLASSLNFKMYCSKKFLFSRCLCQYAVVNSCINYQSIANSLSQGSQLAFRYSSRVCKLCSDENLVPYQSKLFLANGLKWEHTNCTSEIWVILPVNARFSSEEAYTRIEWFASIVNESFFSKKNICYSTKVNMFSLTLR